jgi:hypothetical protein
MLMKDIGLHDTVQRIHATVQLLLVFYFRGIIKNVSQFLSDTLVTSEAECALRKKYKFWHTYGATYVHCISEWRDILKT